MGLYIVIIQLCLLIMTFLIVWCEVSRVFSDTLKSALVRFSVGATLIVLGFYAKFLVSAPYVLVFSTFIVCVLLTTLFIKKLMRIYEQRIDLSRCKNIKECRLNDN